MQSHVSTACLGCASVESHSINPRLSLLNRSCGPSAGGRVTRGSFLDANIRFSGSTLDANQQTREPDDTEGDASFSFSVELEAEDHSDTREAFQLLVQERNALIHQMLVGFNPNSLESCHEISGILADQRGRLKPHYEYLRGVVRTVLDGQKELLAWIESDDFPRALAEVQNDAD